MFRWSAADSRGPAGPAGLLCRRRSLHLADGRTGPGHRGRAGRSAPAASPLGSPTWSARCCTPRWRRCWKARLSLRSGITRAYWGFALAFALLQSLQQRSSPAGLAHGALVLAETRGALGHSPADVCAVLKPASEGTPLSASVFFADRAHDFLVVVLLLLGVLAGVCRHQPAPFHGHHRSPFGTPADVLRMGRWAATSWTGRLLTNAPCLCSGWSAV
jgi:hypothetical protein